MKLQQVGKEYRILLIFAAALTLLTIFLSSIHSANPTKSEVAEIIKAGAPVLGDPGASLTMVEFADFQCRYCKKFFENTLGQLKETYINNGKMKLVFIGTKILGPESGDATEAALCAGDQAKFWQYHDLLYKNQQAANSGGFSLIKLSNMARDLNLDMKQFEECLGSRKYQKTVERNTELSQKYQISGTPHFFIANSVIEGAQPSTTFEAAINPLIEP